MQLTSRYYTSIALYPRDESPKVLNEFVVPTSQSALLDRWGSSAKH